MLAKRIPWEDYKQAARIGMVLPWWDTPYTVSNGPTLVYNTTLKKSMLAIQIEELGSPSFYFDPSYFVEVQEPMKIDLETLLSTKKD